MKTIEFTEKQMPVLLSALEESSEFWSRWSPPASWKSKLNRVMDKASRGRAFTTDEVVMIYEAIIGVPTSNEDYKEILTVCQNAVGEML